MGSSLIATLSGRGWVWGCGGGTICFFSFLS